GLVARALAGNPGPYQVIAADGTRPPWRPGSFDRVLVDVPCTGLRALRRRPEARWRRRPAALDGIPRLPLRLLRTAPGSERVARALAGTPGPYQVIAADGTRPPWRPGSFDRVLVDVPCTGLGALRRRPEARWRRRPADLDGFAPLQRGLLRTALESVRVGGVVGYATCSPHLAETRAVVGDLLKQFPDTELVDARPLLPDLPGLGEGPDVQLWPHLHGTDA